MILSTKTLAQPNAVRGACPGCSHEWDVAFCPLMAEVAADLMIRARCPYGCPDRPVLAMDRSTPLSHQELLP